MENRAVWGLSVRGAQWAFWTFLVMTLITMIIFIPGIYKKIEPLIHWGIREKVEVIMAATPVLVSGLILLITGFFSKKDEWRMSLTGLGVAMSICAVGAITSVIVFVFVHPSIDLVRAYFLISTPITLALIPLLHSGFIAARVDKKRRPK